MLPSKKGMRWPLHGKARGQSIALLVAILSAGGFSCNRKPPIPKEAPVVLEMSDSTAMAQAAVTMQSVSPNVAEGLELSLWATNTLAPDPVAMDIDDLGRIYLTRTHRQKNSEFDIRGHRDWMTASISLQSVEDRRAFLRSTFAPELSDENQWLKDLNNDSIHDWRDLAVEQDEIWRLEDLSGNGMANRSTRILHDFNTEVSDVAGALLVEDEEVYVGIAPDLWRITDTNGDEVLDTKESLATGFMVHIGFGGHGMSGATWGPDGKIYWGIGDIGASITARDNSKHHYPNQGVIVRCNPDGSDFEVFAHGLRNTHEFVFDAFGNLITSDNDGDHRGESERLVYLVEGSDTGWRTNWQFGKYTDPKNNAYKVWMDEKLYLPRWEGQAAYILPPIQNYHNGPTGMQYNPGTALGSAWQDKFFLVEFIGDPSRSHIWAFDLQPKGAGFELKSEQDVLSGVLPTGIRFGPDGALYLADWINGWNTKNEGRVWKLDVSAEHNDLAGARKQTEALMRADYGAMELEELKKHLAYGDMRIRQKAQFELAKRGARGFKVMEEIAAAHPDRYARIHAIWGIGQLAAKEPERASSLIPLLNDPDPEMIAQACRVLGDVRLQSAADALLPLLNHDEARVQFFATQALGRLGHRPAIDPLLDLLAKNNDEDVYLRHAAVLALSRIGKKEPIYALATHEDASLRLAGVLVLRRMKDAGISRFLADEDEYILAEAARAINDDFSIPEALPDLARILERPGLTSEPLLRRAINAALRTGDPKDLDRLLAFALREEENAELRGEALAAMGSWGNPSVLDRVDGRFRGELKRDSSEVIQRIAPVLPQFLSDSNPDIIRGAAQVITFLGITEHNEALKDQLRQSGDPGVRSAMLGALARLNDPEIDKYMEIGMADPHPEVRTTAIRLLPMLGVEANQLPGIVTPIFEQGTEDEQQSMLVTLGELPLEQSEETLSALLERAAQQDLNPAVILELIEAVEASGSERLMASLEPLQMEGYTVEAYQETLYGGSWWPGMTVFTNHPAGQCVRCHAVDGAGGQVGPALDSIGSMLTREQLLESLIEPGARIAPGYGSVSLTLMDGQTINGLLLEEHKDVLILQSSEAEPLEIERSRISKRVNQPSAMPAMGILLSRREIRDLIEYLSSLKGGEPDS